MKKNNLKRFLASLLAVLMLASVTGVAPGVFADNSGKSISTYEANATPQLKADAGIIKVTIKDGIDVKDALAQKLLSNYSELTKEQIAAIDWQYECEGYNELDVKKVNPNTAWGSIGGFTSQTGKVIKINYDHPALVNQADQETFKVAIGNDHSKYCTIQKVAKEDSSIVANENVSVKLAYSDDGTINYDNINEAVFKAAVKSSTPTLTFNDVTITYEAKSEFATDWMPLKGGKGTILTYPGVTEGTHRVKIAFPGNDKYYSKEVELDVTFTGREASTITFKENPVVKITYEEKDGNVEIKFDDLYKAIWENVVESTVPELSLDDVTIKYHATANSGSVGEQGKEWMPLEGGTAKWNGTFDLTYPAISEGDQELRFEFKGNANYTGFSKDIPVKFEGRDPAFEIIPGITQVGMKFKDATNYDYDATANAIREAVVNKLATDESINLSDVAVEYKDGLKFKTLDENADLTTGKEYTFRLSWGGSKGTALYKPFSKEVKLTLVDNRLASSVSIIDKAGITYNMNASEMEDAIFNSVINWDASELPAKDTLTVESFVIEYYATAQFEAGDATIKLPDEIAHAWVPIGGFSKTVDLGLGKIGIVYPQMGAGEQQIRIRFIGSADYKPSEVEAALSVAKADVKVNVKRPVIIMHAGDKDLPEGSITLTPDDKSIDIYTVFAGITSKIGGKVTTSVYLDLPDRYTTDNKLLTKVLDPLFKSVIGRTFTDVLQEGITVGELKQLAAKASEVADKLGKIGIDVESFTKLMDMIANLPGIVDDMRIAIGTPNHAGIYQAFVITNNVNYNTAYGTGTVLVLKQFNGISLVKNSAFDANGGKITVSQAAEIADSVCILSNDDGPLDNEAQGAVRYLFTGIKDSRGLYSNKTMPTEPGRYIVTATVVGGDFFAFPKTFSFKIVADPTPETTPEA